MSTTSQNLINNRILTWDPCHLKEIDEAKKEFIKYRALGHVILKEDGTRMTSFIPAAGYAVILEKKSKENVMKILNEKGDERITWSMNNGRQAKKAKEKFNKLISDGYKAFSVDSRGNKKTKITEFDVDAEEIIMVSPTAKG